MVRPVSDQALCRVRITGDHDAFAELVGRTSQPIWKTASIAWTNDCDGAVDLAQETFLRVYRAAGRYQNDARVSTYIYRIATNLGRSANCEKRKRRRLVSLTGLPTSGEGQEPGDFDAPDERPLQDISLVDSERRAVIKRAIATLPDKYRAPLVLRDVEGKSYDEIAAILQTSEGTVKSRINRARNFLRDKMRNYAAQVVAK